MFQAHTHTYSAHDPIDVFAPGYSIKVDQQEFICCQLFVGEGSITISYKSLSESAVVQVPNGVKPSLSITGIITNYSKTGFTVTSFDFELTWGAGDEKVLLAGSVIPSQVIDGLLIATTESQFKSALTELQSIDTSELAKLAGVQSIPAFGTWLGMENNMPPIWSQSPNSLNAKEAAHNAQLPKTFTVQSFNIPDEKFCICYRLTHNKGQIIRAEISFYAFTSVKGEKAKLLKTWDVSASLGDYMTINYATYWTSNLSVPVGAPLNIVNGALIQGNSQVINQLGYNPCTVVFNMLAPLSFNQNTLIPMTLQLGIFPVAKS